MKKLSIYIVKFCIVGIVYTTLLFIFHHKIFATSSGIVPYLITEDYEAPPPDVSGVGRVIYGTTLNIFYTEGKLILSRNPDGTGDIEVGDGIQIYNSAYGGIFSHAVTVPYYGCFGFVSTVPPTDITYLVVPNVNNGLTARYLEWCGGSKHLSRAYVVNIPPPPPPGPEPFLDLPWDYEGKGLTFSEAANNINSFFDHEYPLLSSGLVEPIDVKDSLIYYMGGNRNLDRDYSSHDGYDFGRGAKVYLNDPVLAAAAGEATYVNSCLACGNMIEIDHGNGYQTRYLHLQKDGLITNIPARKIHVEARQPIGKVGSTGNSSGAHIHFGIFQDKNNDGNFEDNVPDGVTDPFGWQSKDPDPWENYSFFYAGQQRTGNKSYYLWEKKLDGLDKTLNSSGGIATAGQFTFNFPANATTQNIKFSILAAPIDQSSASLVSVGSTMNATATDSFGNFVTQFFIPFTLTIDFGPIDLTRFKIDTLSIYSSPDGNNWTKEPTTVDMNTKKASAQINHLTHFALMAERKDTTPPTTVINFSGLQGKQNWFRSDIAVSLNAQDNNGGLGVDYTLYKTVDNDWQQYTTPLSFTQEGHYKIDYYSVDKDGNIEGVKSTEFDIDKTPPEANIQYNLTNFNIEITGKDNSNITTVTQTSLPKGKLKFSIIDNAGNSLKLIGNKITIGKQAAISIDSLQYNDKPLIILVDNLFFTLIAVSRTKVQRIDQYFQLKGEKIIVFDYSNNKTKIYTLQKGQKILKETRDGIVLLKLTTENGTLKYSY